MLEKQQTELDHSTVDNARGDDSSERREFRAGDVEPPPLSRRQRQVIGYVAQGYTDAEIARALILSPRTVRMHVDTARGKLGVSHRRQLAAAYRRRYPEDPLDALMDL